MNAIAFGLIAALAWGIHDILVRYVSLTLGILQSMLMVLVFGAVAQFALFFMWGDAASINSEALLLSIAAGCAFCFACIGHYHAFARGPVRIVAPLIGCYSVLAFVIAAITGTEVTALQWIMLLVLVIGIGLVARSNGTDDDSSQEHSLAATIGYCAMAMTGFGVTFALGHAASAQADPIATGMITRLVTIALVAIIFVAAGNKFSALSSIGVGKPLFILMAMGALDAVALGVVLAAGIFDRPEFASAASSVFGLVTVVLAWMFLREKISGLQWFGIALVFAAIAYLAAA